MSFDLYLFTTCDHLVYREQEVLDLDRRTLYLERPVTSSGTVKVYASEDLVPDSMYEVRNNPARNDGLNKIIFFKEPWRSNEDYFEISYYTLLQHCTKCSAARYIDDLVYDVKGELQRVRDERLLMQNVEKFTITQIGSNSFHSYIGTNLIGLIGSRVSSDSFVVSQIKDEITRTLQKFQDLQSQYQRSGRKVTDGEMLRSVEDVTVTQDPSDPTLYRANVAVTAQSGKTVEFEQTLRLRV